MPFSFKGDGVKRPYFGALVHWVYGEPHAPKLHGQSTPAVIVKILDAERGRVNLHAFRQDCHGTIFVQDCEHGEDGEPGSWHWPGE